MADVYDLEAARNRKKNQFEDPLYEKQIGRMDRAHLLDELLKFNEARCKAKDPVNLFWTLRGIILFTAIEKKCVTEELVQLASSYRRHLEHQLERFKGPKK